MSNQTPLSLEEALGMKNGDIVYSTEDSRLFPPSEPLIVEEIVIQSADKQFGIK